MPRAPSITRCGCELRLLLRDLMCTPKCLRPPPRWVCALVCSCMPPSSSPLTVSCLKTTRACVQKTTPLLFPRESALPSAGEESRAGASCAPVRQGRLVVMWMRVISFSRSFLKPYFYTHHSFKTKIEEAGREAARSCRESPPAELRLERSRLLPLGDPGHGAHHPGGPGFLRPHGAC